MKDLNRSNFDFCREIDFGIVHKKCQDFVDCHVNDHDVPIVYLDHHAIDFVCSMNDCVSIVVKAHPSHVIDCDDLWISNLAIVHWYHVEMQYMNDL